AKELPRPVDRSMTQNCPMFEFMEQSRETILEVATASAREQVPGPPGEIATYLDGFIGEAIAALKRDAEGKEPSPIRERSKSAELIGTWLQEQGMESSKIAFYLGGVSNALGEVAARAGVSFPARDYQIFDQCLDAAMATAIEAFTCVERADVHRDAMARVSFLAHEIRNTLSAGRLAFSLLKRGVVPIESRTGEVVERSFARAEELVRGALVAAQLDAGAALERENIRVCSFLEEAQANAVPEREIRLIVSCGDPELECSADHRLLTSALSNLVRNAFKYTRSGGTVTLRAFGDEGTIVFEVEDECGGLPPGKSEELFVPFVRRSAEHTGFGLGLPIAKEAIEAHGGEVSVRDLPGKGCVFRITCDAAAR
ncbi:MAG: Sensory box histidine kinase/response regulator, partial [Labilithrix sp.]|nr:Sensory box histidine kinase/response regulator [Labilithrix sp.]